MTRAASGSEERMSTNTRPLALVTGASTGIGYEPARCCAANGFDLLIMADEPAIEDAAASLRQTGVKVEVVQADLATLRGVDTLCTKPPRGEKSKRCWRTRARTG